MMQVDVIVVGSGAGGLTAAIVAAKLGLKVLVCEKSEYFGGTTALSLGAPWIVANKHQAALGIDDGVAAGETYLRAVLGNLYDDEMVSAYLRFGREMIDFMEANTTVAWSGLPVPDYYPESEGASAGRTLLVDPYDGKEIGRFLRKLRPPLPGLAPIGTMQVDMREGGRFQATFNSRADLWFTTKRVLSYLTDVCRFRRGSYLANGNALVGRLIKSALDAGVDLRNAAPVKALIVRNRRVAGVTVGGPGGVEDVEARIGVVLASGGFGANKELTARYMPLPDDHISVQPSTNVGDGILLGQQAGGVLAAPNPDNGVWAPVSIRRRRNGSVDKYPHFGPDRGKPGSIIVDEKGLRFVNEASPYQVFGQAMHAKGIGKAYFIANHKFLRAYGMGLALPAPYPIGHLIRQRYLIKANTLSQLALKLGIPKDTLAATISTFNKNAVAGHDPEFHRGVSAYDASQGDFTHPLHPNLAAVGDGPYYALVLYPGDVSSVLGLQTNAKAQVLDGAGEVVPGLFAVGLDQNTVMKGAYPGGGSGIGPAMTFGYIAAGVLSTEAHARTSQPRDVA